MNHDKLPVREQLLHYARTLSSSGLSVGKSGNISVRTQNGFLITPSGVDYQSLSADDMVLLDESGTVQCGVLSPSSEWHVHRDLYKARPQAQAVVHAHPTYCTALACTGRAIPSFHYMVAIAGGTDIPIAPYALFGSELLSSAIVTTLQQRSACLLANHGMIALGSNLKNAFQLALEVENLAKQYTIALQLGDIQLLSEQQMKEVLETFQSYGQRLK